MWFSQSLLGLVGRATDSTWQNTCTSRNMYICIHISLRDGECRVEEWSLKVWLQARTDWSMSVLLSPWWGSRQWAKMNKQRNSEGAWILVRAIIMRAERTRGMGHLKEWKWVGEKIGSSFELPSCLSARVWLRLYREIEGKELSARRDMGVLERTGTS